MHRGHAEPADNTPLGQVGPLRLPVLPVLTTDALIPCAVAFKPPPSLCTSSCPHLPDAELGRVTCKQGSQSWDEAAGGGIHCWDLLGSSGQRLALSSTHPLAGPHTCRSISQIDTHNISNTHELKRPPFQKIAHLYKAATCLTPIAFDELCVSFSFI